MWSRFDAEPQGDDTAQHTTFLPSTLRSIAGEVAQLLSERKQTIAVAETAAGGLISAALLAQPGASKFYLGGLTLYTLASRIAYSHWTQDAIKDYKGPTPEIVSGLAKHTRETLRATYAVSESGTAGPTGGNTRNRTPGYAALAVAAEGQETLTRELETGLGGDREGNMVAFAVGALELVREVILGKAGTEIAKV